MRSPTRAARRARATTVGRRTSRSSPSIATLPGGAINAPPGGARRRDGDDAVRTRRGGDFIARGRARRGRAGAPRAHRSRAERLTAALATNRAQLDASQSARTSPGARGAERRRGLYLSRSRPYVFRSRSPLVSPRARSWTTTAWQQRRLWRRNPSTAMAMKGLDRFI